MQLDIGDDRGGGGDQVLVRTGLSDQAGPRPESLLPACPNWQPPVPPHACVFFSVSPSPGRGRDIRRCVTRTSTTLHRAQNIQFTLWIDTELASNLNTSETTALTLSPRHFPRRRLITKTLDGPTAHPAEDPPAIHDQVRGCNGISISTTGRMPSCS